MSSNFPVKVLKITSANSIPARRWLHIVAGGDAPLLRSLHSFSLFNGCLLVLGGYVDENSDWKSSAYTLDISRSQIEFPDENPVRATEMLRSSEQVSITHNDNTDILIRNVHLATIEAEEAPPAESFSVNEALPPVGSHAGIVQRRLIDRGGFGEVHEVRFLSLIIVANT